MDFKSNPEAKLSHVAVHYEINRKTLYNRLNGKTQPAREAHADQMMLMPEEEISVLEWVEKRDALGFPPKHKELVCMVINLHNKNYEDNAAIKNLGDHYVTRFLARHKEVATIVFKAMDRERLLAQNPEKFEDFFKCFSECLASQKIAPEDFWNFDENGFQMGKGGGANQLVISRVRVKTPGKQM